MELFKLNGTVYVDTDKANKSIAKTDSKAEGLGKKLSTGIKTAAKWGAALAAGAAAAGAGVVKLTKSVASTGDEIDKNSQKLGLSSKAYQEWEAVLNHAGTSMSNMHTGLKTLTNKIDDAKNGSEDAQKMFKTLGISMDDLKNMSREDIFAATISGFQKMSDSTERAALANDLFGKSGQELTPLFNTSNKETKQLIKNVNEYGGVMNKKAVKASATFQDTLQDMNTAFKGIKNTLGVSFLTPFTKIMNGIIQLSKGNTEKGVKKLSKGIQDVFSAIQGLLPKIKEIGKPIVENISDAIDDNMPTIIKTGINLISKLFEAALNAIPELTSAATDIINSIIDLIGSAGTKDADTGRLESLGQAIVDMISGIHWGDLVINILGLVEAVFDSLLSSIESYAEEHPEIAAAIGGVLVGVLAAISNAEALTALLPEITAALAPIASTVFTGFVAALAAAFAGFSLGKWIGDNYLTTDAMKEYQVDFKLTDFLKFDTQDWKDFWQAFADWWVNDVERWWEDKLDVVGGFFNDIWEGIKDGAKSGLNEVIGVINRAISGVNTVTGLINNIPGVEIPTITEIPKLAKGGTINQSGMALVGEAGAELINLPTGASVTPINSKNNALTGVESAIMQTNKRLERLEELLANQSIVLDSGVLVGHTAKQMDKALGSIASRKARGVVI